MWCFISRCYTGRTRWRCGVCGKAAWRFMAAFWALSSLSSYLRRHHIPLLQLSDHVGLVAPLGLLFGRLANFINGELFGRITKHPIGMVFPTGGPLPRHPSQLYEAGLEGLLLGVIFALCWRAGLSQKQPGSFIALFLIGYGLARFVVEFFREPDAHIGLYEWGGVALSQGLLFIATYDHNGRCVAGLFAAQR